MVCITRWVVRLTYTTMSYCMCTGPWTKYVPRGRHIIFVCNMHIIIQEGYNINTTDENILCTPITTDATVVYDVYDRNHNAYNSNNVL